MDVLTSQKATVHWV